MAHWCFHLKSVICNHHLKSWQSREHPVEAHTCAHIPHTHTNSNVSSVLCSNPASFPCKHDFFLILPNIPRPAVWVCSDMVLLFAHLVEVQINNRFLLPPGNVCYTGSQVDHLHVLHGQVWNRALLVAYHFQHFPMYQKHICMKRHKHILILVNICLKHIMTFTVGRASCH